MMSFWDRVVIARMRLTIRISFILLIVVTIALPYLSIRNQKEARIDSAKRVLSANRELLIERLKQPSTQFALENRDRWNHEPSQDLVAILPLANVPSTNPRSSLSLVTLTGCTMSYPKGKLCIGTASRHQKKGEVYVVGSFRGTRNTAFGYSFNRKSSRPQTKTIEQANRIFITISTIDAKPIVYLMLPMQITSGPLPATANDDLAMSAYLASDDQSLLRDQRPLKSVKATVSEEECTSKGNEADCLRRTLFAIMIEESFFRESVLSLSSPVSDQLSRVRINVNVLAPGRYNSIYKSGVDPASFLTPVRDIYSVLQAGDSVSLRDLHGMTGYSVTLQQFTPNIRRGQSASSKRIASSLEKLGGHILRLIPGTFEVQSSKPAEIPAAFQEASYKMTLTVNGQAIENELALEAGRTAVISMAILLAIVGAWVAIERGVVRRVLRLTRSVADLPNTMKGDGNIDRFDFAKLGGKDEVGVLGTALDTLLARVSEDVRKQKLRLISEKDILHAIGHEIRSPLQALSALHPNESDIEQRYIARMIRAIKALYGETSPAEAFEDVTINEEVFDLSGFLKILAKNAPYSDIKNVVLIASESIDVKVDSSALEDVLEHLLTNADHFRHPNTSIDLSLRRDEAMAVVRISNQGPQIPAELIESIFEYGVSLRQPASEATGRGQGLFVARTYLGKMGSTIQARNTQSGVEFEIRIPAYR